MGFQPSSGRAIAAALALIGLIATTPAASADLQARASMSPTTIRYPGTHFITYRLELTTREEPEVVRVSVIPPTWIAPTLLAQPLEFRRQQLTSFTRFRETGQLQPIDSPVAAAGPVRVGGAGHRIPNDRRAPSGPPGPRGSFWACDRGYIWWWRDVTLRLPPNSSTTITRRFRTGGWAPWRNTDYRVAFAVSRYVGGSRPYVPETVVRPAPPRRRGRSDVRISLRSRPVLIADLGRRILISGGTDPAIRNTWLQIRLRASRVGTSRFGPEMLLANVRTDGAGRFSYNGWRAAYNLYYRVWAEYQPASDAPRQRSCGLILFTGHVPQF